MQHLSADEPHAVEAVVAALRAGQAVVVPTETIYGLAALPERRDLLLELKGRPEAVPIAVLVADVGQAASAAGRALPRLAERLAAAFWPGPLTIVVPTAAGPTLGVRCPDHDFVRRVAVEVGPIATTSANRHGEATPPTAAAAAATLAGDVAVVVDGGALDGLASTVVDATGDELRILREGPIGGDELRRVLKVTPMARSHGGEQGADAVAHLQKVGFFEGFNDNELRRVAELAEEVDAEAGSELTDQGRPGQTAYVIVEGTASVEVGGASINTVGPGDMVGEMSLIDHRPRTATVRATTDMRLLAFDATRFRRLLDEMPKAQVRVMEQLVERLRQRDLA